MAPDQASAHFLTPVDLIPQYQGKEPDMGKHEAEEVTLRVADRCDAKECGAQAYIRAILFSGLELLFCAHPGTQHKEAIADHLLWWQDETFRLTEKSG